MPLHGQPKFYVPLKRTEPAAYGFGSLRRSSWYITREGRLATLQITRWTSKNSPLSVDLDASRKLCHTYSTSRIAGC
jgi:hypothetical protein